MNNEEKNPLLPAEHSGKDIHRREFVKLTAGCALALAIGSSGILTGCTVAKLYNTTANKGEVRIPLAEFSKDKMRTIRIPKLKYDILVIKNNDKEYTAILLECTHRHFELNVNAKGINCPAHGSAYDFDGQVKKGPSTQALRKFHTSFDGDDLVLKD